MELGGRQSRTGAPRLHSFAVDRNETFWAEAWPVLAEFWWQYVVPARLCLSQGTPVDLRKFEPPAEAREAKARHGSFA